MKDVDNQSFSCYEETHSKRHVTLVGAGPRVPYLGYNIVETTTLTITTNLKQQLRDNTTFPQFAQFAPNSSILRVAKML